jgi:hypothetical protein
MHRNVQRRLAHVPGLLIVCLVAASAATGQEKGPMVLAENMGVLRCSMPEAGNRFVGSSAPGQLFMPGEPVNVTLALAKGGDSGKVDLAVEIQEITTRDPAATIKGAFTDTAGDAPLIGLEGKPIRHAFAVTFGAAAEANAEKVEIKDLPVPARFGTYALVLERGGKRLFLGTVARLTPSRADANLENSPIFGEFQMFDDRALTDVRAAACERMGVRGMRMEVGWSQKADGTTDWSRFDELFEKLTAHRIQLMVTLGGHTGWAWPFNPNQTPAVVGPKWDGNPYGGQSDWLCGPQLYERYGKWVAEFCGRYWKDGKGGLWGLDNYNEPWEGGGISGWARDCLEYRKIQKTIADAAHSVDKRIKLCAASSIMNTEDKLYSDGSAEFDKYVDVFTDHYVVPSMCYGPLVAAARGKESVETETWFVNGEYLMPQVVQFLASGQKRLSPWHPRVLFDTVPGSKDRYLIPTPVVAASAAFNHFLAGKPFEKIAFRDHLPWVFQFGRDDDAGGMLVVFGQLMPIASKDPKDRLWSQVDAAGGGTITIDNADGLLKFYDLAGNPQYVGDKQVKLPMSIFPAYIACEKGPAAAAARIKAARIEGKRPVEIIPRDFTTRIDAAGAVLAVEVHNCLNRPIAGKLAAGAPAGVSLKSAEAPVELAAGERKTVTFALASAKADAGNNYPFKFRFAGDAGEAEYAEVMNVALAPRGTKTIDGNLDDWKDVPGITMAAKLEKAEATENLRRPWLELKDKLPDGTFAEVKLAWDADYLYLAAQVNDPTPQASAAPMAGRDENAYFHSKASDTREPYATFLKKYPGRSFAEVPYVYCYSPEKPGTPALPTIPFRRDRVQIGLDVTDDWHDLKADTDRVPYGFHAVPDTDYEYSLYWCTGDQAELWRHLAPGVPRINDWPHQPRGQRTTGPVPAAKQVAKRIGNTYIYEAAIPKAELDRLKLQPGTTFGLAIKIGNGDGPSIVYAADKAATKLNGLTLHPYWERTANCGVRWTLGE